MWRFARILLRVGTIVRRLTEGWLSVQVKKVPTIDFVKSSHLCDLSVPNMILGRQCIELIYFIAFVKLTITKKTICPRSP